MAVKTKDGHSETKSSETKSRASGYQPKAVKAKNKEAKQRAPLTITRPELLVDGSDNEFRRLVHNIFAFAARHEAMRAGHGARIGLTGIEYTFLISIRHLEDEGEVSVKKLSEHLHVSGPFATVMVGKLIKRDLVSKAAAANDRRRASLTVTQQGHALLAELAPAQRIVNDIQFGCLSEEEFHMLGSVLERLISCADRALATQAYLSGTQVPAE